MKTKSQLWHFKILSVGFSADVVNGSWSGQIFKKAFVLIGITLRLALGEIIGIDDISLIGKIDGLVLGGLIFLGEVDGLS